MVERDIQEFLQTGSWTSSRAKSPARSSTDASNSSRIRISAPVRANQSSKLDLHAPRAFNLGLHKARFPPPPIVEDEVESLAREHGSSVVSAVEEQAQFPGDPEQFPIIQEVHENNPERRFVLVPNGGSSVASDAGGTDDDRERRRGKGDGEYEANTCRKYVVVPSDDDSSAKNGREPTRRRGVERRKSRQDLPRIDTGLRQEEQTSSTGRRDRRKSTTDRPPGDYFGRQEPSQHNGDGLLSPVITSKHSTKGRDRAYYEDGGLNRSASRSNRGPSADRRGPSVDEKRRGDGYRGTHSLDPPPHKRTTSSTESPRYDRRPAASSRNREEDLPSRGTKYASPPRNKRRDSSPTLRENRKSNSPPYPPSARDKDRLPGRSPSFKGRRRPPVDDDYSDDDYPQFHRSNRRPQSIIHQDDRNYLLSPEQAHPSFDRPRSRNTTPLASPRATQDQFPHFQAPELGTGPRSATFPYTRDSRRVDERPVPPLSPSISYPDPPKSRILDEDGPSRSQGRSRASSMLGAQVGVATAAAAAAMAIPILVAGGNSAPVDRRRPPVPPPHASPPRSQPQWQPPAFNPTEQRATLDRPVVSYRRYSQDVQEGTASAFPECPRTMATSGHLDWLTLPQARGFDICPTCYENTFANTQFRHSFIPAPFRNQDIKVACDFGSSHWYRVAWLMTLKYGLPDLRLLQRIAAVGAKQQECSGNREASRIWYSILDPNKRRPIQHLTVCPHCAKTIEVILPNLFGVFVELDSPAVPTRGVCSMHFAPGRQRFLKLFDLMESTSDKALARNSPPDLQELADKVRDITLDQECMRDQPVHGQRWNVMESIPEFTVCEECFEDVVAPIMESDRPSSVARNFFKKRQAIPVAACQLYSNRMRDIFRSACQRDDLHHLEDMVKERLDIEASIKAQLAERPGEAETRALLKEWEKWE